MATWNAGDVLQHCLDSIFEQSFNDWELLIADGGSTDDTVQIISRNRSRIAWTCSEPDRGIYDAWNKALANATGEYVCFVGADDRWAHPDSLETLFRAIGASQYDLVTTKGKLVDTRLARPHEFGNPWDYNRICRRMTICHPGALHNRALFQAIGHFDTSFRICADYDFLLRMPPSTRTLHVDQPLLVIGGGGISRQRRWLMLSERYRAQANCPRIGRFSAAVNYMDKLWRIPVARLLGIPN